MSLRVFGSDWPDLSSRFVAVGEVMLEVFPQTLVAGSVIHAPVRVRVGGSAVTCAIAAAAEGVASALVGRVGDDPAGRVIHDCLLAKGVQPLLQVDPTLSTGTHVNVGSTTIVTDRGANVRLEIEAPSAEAVFISGYVVFQADDCPLARLGDPQWLAVSGGSPSLVRLRSTERANALFVNDAEFVALGGDIEVLKERFRMVCVTRGQNRASAYLDGQTADCRPPRTEKVLPSGGGDALAGSMLASLLLGRGLDESLERACAAGARAIADHASGA